MSEFNVPTHEIVTPIGGNVVVLKDFISGYDDEAIEAIYTGGQHEINTDAVQDGKSPNFKISGDAIQRADREGVKRVVLSVDGDNGDGRPNGIVDIVYSMRAEDAAFVKREVTKIVNPPQESAEKKGNAANSTSGS